MLHFQGSAGTKQELHATNTGTHLGRWFSLRSQKRGPQRGDIFQCGVIQL